MPPPRVVCGSRAADCWKRGLEQVLIVLCCRDSFVLACWVSPATSTALQLAQEFAQTEKAGREVTHPDSMWHDTQ